MEFLVKDVPAEGKRFEDEIPADALGVPDLQVDGRVCVQVEARKAGSQIHVRGHLHAALRPACHRCLERYADVVDTDLEVFFQPGVPEQESADSVLYHYEGDHIDLIPHIRDVILLALPFKQLCQPDCLGLCARCGADLNADDCACRAATEETAPGNPFAEFFRKREESAE